MQKRFLITWAKITIISQSFKPPIIVLKQRIWKFYLFQFEKFNRSDVLSETIYHNDFKRFR